MSGTLKSFAELNALSAADAQAIFLRCCGSRRWAQEMAKARPFADARELYSKAESVWFGLGREDWLEAFSHHPRIGEAALRSKFAATAAWCNEEQKGAQGASEQTLKELAQGNASYERRFGYVFLICATGKSAEEMLRAQQARLQNTADAELRHAAIEQDKITKIRLEKLFHHE